MSQVPASVIICAYTEERLQDIHEAVDSVLAQTPRPHQVIVAVDHNSRLLEILKSELPTDVQVVLNDGARGLSETRNTGIRLSTGEVVAFIDDDAVAEPKWLETLLCHFGDRRVVAVGGRAVPQWLNGGRPRWFPEELDWVVGCTYKGLPVHGTQVRNVIGCNMAFRVGCFKTAGFFNTKVGRNGRIQGAGEEAEICQRISQTMPGSLIIFEPEAIIHHKVPSWRTGAKYIVRRSYDEGLCKTTVKSLSPDPRAPALSTESTYLRYLLLTAMPSRITRGYRPIALAQLAAMLCSALAAGLGFLRGAGSVWLLARGTTEPVDVPRSVNNG